MNILLKEDVEKLGVAGDVVTVADGYARNFLIPQGLAVKATGGQIKQVDVIRRQALVRREKLEARLAALAAKLTSTTLTFEANASERGRLYGSVTQDQIAEALEAAISEPVDRRKMESGPLRQLGLHAIPIRLSKDLIPEVQVIVHREGEDPEMYLQAATEEAAEEIEEETEDEIEEETLAFDDEVAFSIDEDELAED